jgi:hypothetical protein
MSIYRNKIRSLAACGLLVLGGACATGGAGTYPANAPARPASGVPERFVVEGTAGAAAADTTPGSGCRSPMVDPRDGARLRMVSAQGGRIADYEVPAGRYGVGAGELLRLECNTGRVVGVVPGRG